MIQDTIRKKYEKHIACNSGMETKYNSPHYILKNPCFMLNIENIVKDTSIKIKTVIIPIRDLKTSANHGYHQGGMECYR